MPYVIAPLDQVKGLNRFPEYLDAMASVEAAVRARAATIWEGSQPGGIFPVGQQYGIGQLRKNDMAGDTTDSTASGSYTFRKSFTATANTWTDIFRYTVRRDMIHGFIGFLVTDDILRILQLRMEIGQNLFPVIDIQEAQRYDKFAIIFKADRGAELVADPNTRVLVRVFLESQGLQRITPLGMMAYRRTDLVVTEI